MSATLSNAVFSQEQTCHIAIESATCGADLIVSCPTRGVLHQIERSDLVTVVEYAILRVLRCLFLGRGEKLLDISLPVDPCRLQLARARNVKPFYSSVWKSAVTRFTSMADRRTKN